MQEQAFNPWVRKIPWNRKWQPTPVFLLGEFYRHRSLEGYTPWCHRESDMTEHLSPCAHTCAHTHTRYQFSSHCCLSLLFPFICLWPQHQHQSSLQFLVPLGRVSPQHISSASNMPPSAVQQPSSPLRSHCHGGDQQNRQQLVAQY